MPDQLPFPREEVEFERLGAIGLIRLNRPKALNALSLAMVRMMDGVLARWAVDPAVRAVVVTGTGDRAFCAGGDVRAVWADGIARRRHESDGALTSDFFRNEYRLNRRIHRYPKPYVALADGIVMGGGVGVSVHGSDCVFTERTVFAMPETLIGFFPDVGAAWHLARCPGETGAYLALTGLRLGAADALAMGLGKWFVHSARLPAVIEGLAETGDVESVLGRFSSPAAASELLARREVIDRCFSADTAEEILDSVQRHGDAETLDTLLGRSPTSLKISLRHVRACRDLAIEDVLRQDFRLSQGCMAGRDFYEGIRAQLVDKDYQPKWDPPSLGAVDNELVAAHFRPPAGGDLDFPDE